MNRVLLLILVAISAAALTIAVGTMFAQTYPISNLGPGAVIPIVVAITVIARMYLNHKGR